MVRMRHNKGVSKVWTTQKENREHNNTITSQKRVAPISQRGKGHSAEDHKGGRDTALKAEAQYNNKIILKINK